MAAVSQQEFLDELSVCADRVCDIVCQERYQERFVPQDLREGVTLYTRSGGKRLRPAILLWSCGAVGGDPEKAWPAAAAVELFHTWTLVHDDIIDRDDMRRGGPTLHEHFRRAASKRYPALSEVEQRHYGISVSILSGDVQHGWATTLLTELTHRSGIDPEVTLHLIERLDNKVLNLLVSGELLDIQFCHRPPGELTLENIEDMLWKKTSVLYKYCAEAGALIGINSVDKGDPRVRALTEFSSLCGTAFQLQDDILGIVGDSQVTGKPVGNDIREGKRTTLIYYAWQGSNEEERALLERTLGNQHALNKDIEAVIELVRNHGGVEKTRERANTLIERAMDELMKLEPSRYRDLLEAWAEFLVAREV